VDKKLYITIMLSIRLSNNLTSRGLSLKMYLRLGQTGQHLSAGMKESSQEGGGHGGGGIQFFCNRSS